MKKWISCFLCLVIAFTLTGCDNNKQSGKAVNQTAGVNDVLEAGLAEKEDESENSSLSVASSTEETVNGKTESAGGDIPKAEAINESNTSGHTAIETEGVDVDLTTLSSTMVYSEVYNMLVSPENYIGKTVKMDGLFALYHDETTDNYYFACIVADATACCSQGIEFVLKDDYTYPDDYPTEGGEICVIGEFDTYQEAGYTYCTLRDAELV